MKLKNISLIQNIIKSCHEFLHAILRQFPQFFPNKLLIQSHDLAELDKRRSCQSRILQIFGGEQKIFLSWLLGHVGCDRGNDNIASFLVKSIGRDDYSGPHFDSREVRKRERNESNLAPFTRCHIWNR